MLKLIDRRFYFLRNLNQISQAEFQHFVSVSGYLQCEKENQTITIRKIQYYADIANDSKSR